MASFARWGWLPTGSRREISAPLYHRFPPAQAFLAHAKFGQGAGVGLVPYLPQPDHLEALPTKLFEYMALGVPILASDFPLWRNLIQDARVGQVAPPTARGLASGLKQMIGDPQRLLAFSLAGQAAYEARYRWEQEQEQLEWHIRRAGVISMTKESFVS